MDLGCEPVETERPAWIGLIPAVVVGREGVDGIVLGGLERLDSRDLVQMAVGSLAGALIYAYQTDVARLADALPVLNTALIVLVTLVLSLFIGYGIGVRRLGSKRMRLALGVIPVRIAAHYAFALVFSALILWLLSINTLATPLGIAIRRIIVLSLPASILGSAVDLVESQKEDAAPRQ